ncbi:hypothetical protein [Dyadobacter sp. Leaf189]|uniref:hypothetical protein n=1 Tax=Dyadobacter sp. Leaf189 TaxID=1736295 RepID=UPI0006F5BA10|nr:hypothetical protein [Dyadobacter sp. Leaf189]KQS24742.1 hypothetical protein ASG33_23600 [Dyadobacter sp. Leaf189]
MELQKVKNYRFVGLLGNGRERYSDKELDQEQPTEPIVIDAFGFSDVYRYAGYVFLDEEWFTKYDRNWRLDTAKIDELLVDLVKYSVKDSKSENLARIEAYLQSPPETIEEAAEVWKSFHEPTLKRI